MGLTVKICGLKTEAAVAAAARGGAAFVGFIFYPPSPRALTPAEAGALIAAADGAKPVGVFVDPSDELLAATLAEAPLGLIQLHGAETPERVAAVRRRFGLPVIRALPLSGPQDLARAEAYADAADWLLFDAKPPAAADALPGGNGLAFDWRLLAGRRFAKPWLLSGGLDAGNLAEAVRTSGASAVDVSSGVESARGVKDISKIEAFLEAARGL